MRQGALIRDSSDLQGFQPDMTELPAGFTGRSFYSRKRVAQAHGILSADLLSKRASTAAPPEKRARAGAAFTGSKASSQVASAVYRHLCQPLVNHQLPMK